MFALLAPDIGDKERQYMNKKIKYTDAPNDVKEFLKTAKVIPNFRLTPESVKELKNKRAKKPVTIYLTVETIEKFKKTVKKDGGRYQTMISDVLDTYTHQYL